ncbi:unnamed protein product [Eretmochelys imbricata]
MGSGDRPSGGAGGVWGGWALGTVPVVEEWLNVLALGEVGGREGPWGMKLQLSPQLCQEAQPSGCPWRLRLHVARPLCMEGPGGLNGGRGRLGSGGRLRTSYEEVAGALGGETAAGAVPCPCTVRVSLASSLQSPRCRGGG